MGRRFFTVLLASALVAGLFTALPAGAQEAAAVTIPEVVQIDDPKGDANYLNDQSLLNAVPPTQDVGTPADGGSTSDLLKVWYTTTADTISAHIQTELPGPATAGSYIYRVYSNPGEGSVTSSTLGCLRFFIFMPSANPPVGGYSGPLSAGLLDYCDKGMNYTTDAAPGKLTITEMADGTGVMTIEVPRSYSPKLANGQVLTTPLAQVQNLVGTGTDGNGQPIPATDGTLPSGNWRRGPQIDNTKIGTDFTITGPAPVAPPKPTKPGKPAKPAKPSTTPGDNTPPGAGKKNGCDNGKGKKKGACPTPPAAATCPAYTPGDLGADAKTTVVTETATEAAPLVFESTAEMGGPASPLVDVFDLRSFVYHNVQVDSSNPDAGLYVKVEFTEHHDYDLALFLSDGTEAASSGESQPEPGLGAGSPDGAWEGGSNYEFLKGIRTADCAGYTARVAGYLTTGGPVKISMWLGDVVGEPAAPGA